MSDWGLDAVLEKERLIVALPFLLLVVAMFQTRVNRMRGVAAIAAGAGLATAWIVAKAPLLAAGWGLLLVATLLLLTRRLLSN
ncbi:MAG TPA: hypothetical protein VK472_02850, partial [Allosphingosinicella sp.]|nr:hypothetical protein [Allosphingosinicella sp.]